MSRPIRSDLTEMYGRLFAAFGPQRWWPASPQSASRPTPFEVMVGAILTQNTNWGNVVKAIVNLKKAKVLTPAALKKIPAAKLAVLIKSSGYFNIKANRLKNYVDFMFTEYDGRVGRMAREELPLLREKLLGVNGVGPETADSILLYALNKPVFVIDAYTKRILRRHNLIPADADYEAVQNIFMKNFPPDVAFYNEFHALFVRLGAEICKPHPSCEQCPLNDFHYSIKRRCPQCYRHLSRSTERKRNQRLCPQCSTK